MWQTEAGITPQTCTARREPRYSSITTIGTTFHIQYRSIQIKVNTVPHTTTQELLKKARGVSRGAVALRPLCGFPQLPKAKKPGLLLSKKVKIKPKTNHTINKEKENHKEK